MASKKISIDSLIKTTDVRFGTSGLRGLVEQMSDELCYAYVSAFLRAVAGDAASDKRVVLGHDLRPSSPRIASACAKAIIDSGREVMYAGELPTPALASYAYEYQLPAVVVTGSHIPFNRNGIKFYKATGEISKLDELLIQQASVDLPDTGTSLPNSSVVRNASVKLHYLKRYIDFFESFKIAGMRVAIYEHSSVARDILREILEALGATVISLGRSEEFVPIDTEAVRPEDVLQAQQWAKEYSFDAIISTDGDADRPLIGDEHGNWLRGDVVGVLCAKFLSAETVVTPVSSNTLTEKSEWFKQVIRTKIGSPYVIEAMQSLPKSKNVVGFEANGGFLLGTNVILNNSVLNALPTRDAVLPVLALLSLSKQNQKPISALVGLLPNRYTASDRLQNFSTELSSQLISTLNQDSVFLFKLIPSDLGQVVSIDHTDGYRVILDGGDIIHFRPSGNAPELRCYVESDTQEKAQHLCKVCLSNLKRIYS
ncbi:phosphomannomutase [Methylotenera mobilis]|uniref:Phosphoglucomutase/phosphomannomutase alpha/beta/alpha domain I n=1 Tax=Methylotenera mobilis (strain JLW8 / ATCC BAA-1282 / DSM 17540) TaxID=583345 RepID=C6WVI2_METML|nr:phosphomannomutase [Methylotenera mobilis]ACT47931.1 phosphoglucomutase/phosphomannomutase alpha/beta/alpha domain I [Methylotenera mobilis JLW8]